MTAKRMISGEVLKQRNGLRIRRGYETLFIGSSQFTLTPPYLRMQFHSLHPPAFAAIRKGLSLTEFYSGATRLSDRFNEGLLLRRSQRQELTRLVT